MNRQTGPIKIQATLGDVTYYKRNGVYLVKRKSVVSRNRLKYSREYEAFRRHQQEFGQASIGGKWIRNAFAPLLEGLTDPNCVGRLTKSVLNVIQSDPVNPAGQRMIQDGDLGLLNGFEFNARCALSQVLKVPIQLETDSTTGSVILGIQYFIPARHLRYPKIASHFQLVLGIASMNVSSGQYQTNFAETVPMPVKSNLSSTLSISCALSQATTDPVMIVVGVRFSQLVSGVYEPVLNAKFLALGIVQIMKAGI